MSASYEEQQVCHVVVRHVQHSVQDSSREPHIRSWYAADGQRCKLAAQQLSSGRPRQNPALPLRQADLQTESANTGSSLVHHSRLVTAAIAVPQQSCARAERLRAALVRRQQWHQQRPHQDIAPRRLHHREQPASPCACPPRQLSLPGLGAALPVKALDHALPQLPRLAAAPAYIWLACGLNAAQQSCSTRL